MVAPVPPSSDNPRNNSAASKLTAAGRPAVSDARLRANRLNARKSTGPRTPDGKARSSKNAITHGVFAEAICIDGEDEIAYRQFRISIFRRTDPRDALELQFVEQIIRAGWKLRRLQGAEMEIYIDRLMELQEARPQESIGPGYVLGSLIWDSPEFGKVQLYEQRLINVMHRATEQLRKLRKDGQAGCISDFAGELIKAEEQEMDEMQNEPNAAETDASAEPTGGYATDAIHMDTDESIQRPSDDPADRMKEPPPGAKGV